ncbi:MAG: tRNA (guanosine(37)-N1)-methyltransferase TrmD [Epsilonproteobacteria bacterium]|nr:tRNA (guanosine(37)-N1)-methyltransferase TrmD [Campylobacterota bacterium]MBD3839719.1 tRNA (guanosine(37)-N1)-methyltransferase TrmD [Campylobacterota bacterium]
MKFSFVTLFPSLIDGYFGDSILKRALDKSLFELESINPRDFSKDKHKKVDDKMIGGGAGMLMMPQPLFDTLSYIKKISPDAHIIFTTPVAKVFKQHDAKRLATYEHVVFVSGRYEGIDERVIETFADELFSIGDFILTGGELPSLVMCDSIVRNIDGVLGNHESLVTESFEESLLEAPSFTKPNIYKNKSVPLEFLKGNHAKILDLKFALAKCKTQFFRPELIKNLTK